MLQRVPRAPDIRLLPESISRTTYRAAENGRSMMAQTNLLAYFKPAAPDTGTRSLDQAKVKSSSDGGTYPSGKVQSNTLTLFSADCDERQDAVESQSEILERLQILNSPLSSLSRLVKIEPHHLPAIKQLTASALPVRYPDKFFNETTSDCQAANLSRVILYHDKPVGWIRCRLEPMPGPPTAHPTTQIYIQALCVLAPYRNLGLATQLLRAIIQAEIKAENVAFVYAHVWESNEDALAWYENRGFKRTMLIDQYYRRLKPGGAWIVRREMG